MTCVTIHHNSKHPSTNISNIARSSTRHPLNSRPNPTNMTKACTPVNPISNFTINQSKSNISPIHTFYSNRSHYSTTQPILLHTAHILHSTNFIPLYKQHEDKVTIQLHKTNNPFNNHNRNIHNTSTSHTNTVNPRIGI
eukprot:bmy_06836T0